jgi:thiol-disulfide isomerase/thioredoxin
VKTNEETNNPAPADPSERPTQKTPETLPLDAPNEANALKPWHLALGLSALIPFLGLPSALFALVLGLQTFRRKGWALVLLALGGFALTAWWGQPSLTPSNVLPGAGSRQDARVRKDLHRLVVAIEAFRETKRRLPDDLPELAKETGRDYLDLPTDVSPEPRPYYYHRLGDPRGYLLFSRGHDGEAFTEDDILPELTNEERLHWGYRVRSLDPSALPGSTQVPAYLRWRDPEDGLAEARRTGRPILLYFTAEWCGKCHQLEKDAFSRPEISRLINTRFVPIHVVDRMNEEHKNRPLVRDLQKRFQVKGFPTLVPTTLDYTRYDTLVGYGGDYRSVTDLLGRFLKTP